jgi:hypothetical protein
VSELANQQVLLLDLLLERLRSASVVLEILNTILRERSRSERVLQKRHTGAHLCGDSSELPLAERRERVAEVRLQLVHGSLDLDVLGCERDKEK